MIRAIVSTWLCFLFWSPPVAAEERVDVALVLAADISYSIGPYELDLQRRGYIRAFRSTDVIKTITSGRRGRIAVSYLEWAGENSQTLVLPRTIIDGFESSYGVAEALTKAPLQRSGETSISGALDTARFPSWPTLQKWRRRGCRCKCSWDWIHRGLVSRFGQKGQLGLGDASA